MTLVVISPELVLGQYRQAGDDPTTRHFDEDAICNSHALFPGEQYLIPRSLFSLPRRSWIPLTRETIFLQTDALVRHRRVLTEDITPSSLNPDQHRRTARIQSVRIVERSPMMFTKLDWIGLDCGDGSGGFVGGCDVF